jgi:hypothetical protein
MVPKPLLVEGVFYLVLESTVSCTDAFLARNCSAFEIKSPVYFPSYFHPFTFNIKSKKLILNIRK